MMKSFFLDFLSQRCMSLVQLSFALTKRYYCDGLCLSHSSGRGSSLGRALKFRMLQVLVTLAYFCTRS